MHTGILAQLGRSAMCGRGIVQNTADVVFAENPELAKSQTQRLADRECRKSSRS